MKPQRCPDCGSIMRAHWDEDAGEYVYSCPDCFHVYPQGELE